ncbi:MarR family winged helix-turn-helix transcriptional regulator [Haliea sp. E17]|uniref:MarR family winged helix-turn-helix transcriptional regulator n=1 Tax=Haliea sp. E17 TaxID=3401576 RepID=UPI003AABA019
MKDDTHKSIRNFRDTVGRGLVGHLMVIAHFVQKSTLDSLLESGKYQKLSLAYASYMGALAEGPCTPGALAAKLDTSKQACSKIIRELESLGLTSRSANPEDSRSSLITLTGQGQQLLQDGMQVANRIQAELADAVGEEALRDLDRVIDGLRIELGIPQPDYTFANAAIRRAPRLNALLPLLNDALRLRLATALAGRGFAGLKSSFGQVLGLAAREGRHIQYMASILGVSKQSVAATVAELDTLGYVVRETDPADRRQVIVRLSPRGEELIRSSIDCARELETELRDHLGERDFQVLENTLEALYLKMAEKYDNAGVLPARIQQLSDFLINELGVAGTRTLAQHLLNITRGN